MSNFTAATDEDPPFALLVYKGTGIAILTLMNWFANTTCIIVLRRLKELNPVTKILMFSMTGADLATGCSGVFMVGAVIAHDWPFGYTMCRISGVVNNTLIAGAALSLLAINTERFIAVTKPLHYGNIVTTIRAYVALVCLWLLALSSGLVNHLLPGRKTVFNPVLHSCVADPIDPEESDLIGTAWNCIFFLLPILITLVMFLRLYRIAKHHATRIAAQSVNNERKPSLKGSATFCLMTVAILTLSIPTLFGYLYENLTRTQLPIWFSYLCTHLVFSYSVVNVGIYYTRNSAFKRTAKKLWGDVVNKGNEASENSAAAVVSHGWR